MDKVNSNATKKKYRVLAGKRRKDRLMFEERLGKDSSGVTGQLSNFYAKRFQKVHREDDSGVSSYRNQWSKYVVKTLDSQTTVEKG